MHKKYVVRLSDDERGVCQEIITHRKGASQKFRRAQRLLQADADGPGWPEVRRAEAFHCRVHPLENRRTRLVTEGVAGALEGKKRREPPPPCTRAGEAEAQGSAMRLGNPPAGDGHGPWQRLADALVALAGGDSLRHETVRTGRKKTAGRNGRSPTG